MASTTTATARKKDPGRKRGKKGNSKAKKKGDRKRKKGSQGWEETKGEYTVPELYSDSDSEDEAEESDGDMGRKCETEREVSRSVAEEKEFPDARFDFDDNLTYHEDSLSVMKGHVTTDLGENVPIWITTDSGSMTQLIQGECARKLKLKPKPLSDRQVFSIRGPGGGEDVVDKYVQLKVRLLMKPQGKISARGDMKKYEDNEGEEVEQEVSLHFGVCESLPVPLLWGGEEMRNFDLVDYHSKKILSMKLGDNAEGPKYVTKSMSWLVAAAEMAGQEDPRYRKVYRDFIPSTNRMANMVKGERQTINMPAVLLPNRDNIVRVKS